MNCHPLFVVSSSRCVMRPLRVCVEGCGGRREAAGPRGAVLRWAFGATKCGGSLVAFGTRAGYSWSSLLSAPGSISFDEQKCLTEWGGSVGGEMGEVGSGIVGWEVFADGGGSGWGWAGLGGGRGRLGAVGGLVGGGGTEG